MENKSIYNPLWKEVILEKSFQVEKGIYLHSSKITSGKIPYITAKAVDNGINNFINNENLFHKNCITIEKVSLKAFFNLISFIVLMMFLF